MSTKKTIVLQTIRQGKIGGGETHVLDLLTYLNRDLYEPKVLLFTPGPMEEKLSNLNIDYEIINTEYPFDIRVFKAVSEYIKKSNIELVHAHGTRAFSNVVWSSKMLNIPIIYTVHGWSFHPDQNFFKKHIRIKAECFLTQRADHIISVSNANQTEGEKYFKLNRCSLVRNGINMERFNSNMKYLNLRANYNIGENKVVIGYVARITKQKDPFTMIKAFKIASSEIDNIVLLIVGNGDLLNKTKRLANKLLIREKIIFDDFRSDVPELLSTIDIYCLPSLWEGLPIGVIEAMSMSKAIIATSVDGTKELIDHNENGLLFPSGDEGILAMYINKLSSDINLRKKYGENASKKVSNSFSSSEMTKKIESIYSSLI